MALPLEHQQRLTVADLKQLLELQQHVVSRDQLLRAGYPDDFGRGKVRSRRWQRLHPGVYLVTTGVLTPLAAAWAGLLAAPSGAVLGGGTAARLDGWLERPARGSSSGPPVELVVPHTTGPRVQQPGLVMRRQRRPIQEHSLPPRTTVPATALDLVAVARGEDDVVAILTPAARRQRSLDPLRRELERRERLRHRRLVEAVLSPREAGHESTLEWRFTRGVVRAHGLPEPTRQAVAALGGRQIRGDQVLEEFGTRIELDGQIHLFKLDDDVWRDNLVLLERAARTLRYRWQHVVARPCETAGQVETAFRLGGWSGWAARCGPDCRLRRG